MMVYNNSDNFSYYWRAKFYVHGVINSPITVIVGPFTGLRGFTKAVRFMENKLRDGISHLGMEIEIGDPIKNDWYIASEYQMSEFEAAYEKVEK